MIRKAKLFVLGVIALVVGVAAHPVRHSSGAPAAPAVLPSDNGIDVQHQGVGIVIGVIGAEGKRVVADGQLDDESVHIAAAGGDGRSGLPRLRTNMSPKDTGNP
jgi:hypothetical protein